MVTIEPNYKELNYNEKAEVKYMRILIVLIKEALASSDRQLKIIEGEWQNEKQAIRKDLGPVWPWWEERERRLKDQREENQLGAEMVCGAAVLLGTSSKWTLLPHPLRKEYVI